MAREMKPKASKQQNKFVHIITAPIRALCKARDLYVKSMLDCASANAIGLQGTSQAASLPRSFSTASSRSYEDRDDYRELLRAASARSSSYMKQPEIRRLPPRSISVAMGRIDEERPINFFGEDIKSVVENHNRKNDLKYPRSKSDVVALARTTF